VSFAAHCGWVDIVTYLLDVRNYEVYQTTRHLKTPLHSAQNGHEEMVHILLAHGANVHATVPDFGYTALIYSSVGVYLGITIMLIKHDPAVIRARMSDGETPFSVAAKSAYFEVFKLLLKSRCDINDSCSISGDTLAHIACREAQSLLLECILAQSSSSLWQTNDEGETPLMIAASQASSVTVDVIFRYCEKKGINSRELFARDKTGRSILSVAVSGGNSNIVGRILEIGGNEGIGLIDNHGLSPLLYAIRDNQPDVVRLLLTRSPKLKSIINQRIPQYGRTSLSWASFSRDKETALQL